MTKRIFNRGILAALTICLVSCSGGDNQEAVDPPSYDNEETTDFTGKRIFIVDKCKFIDQTAVV